MSQRKVTLTNNDGKRGLFGTDNGCGPGHSYGGVYRSYTGEWVAHGFHQTTWTEDSAVNLGRFRKRRHAKKALRKFLERK
jgi:hypothetical protein